MARRRHRGHGGGNRLLRQASLEAAIKYGPEARALAELMSEAKTDLKTGVKAEAGAAEGIKAIAREAMPQLQRVYTDAGHSHDQAQQDVQSALAGLGGASDTLKGVSARESGNAKQRLTEAAARAQEELVGRQVDAEQGRSYAVKNLQSKYQSDTGKIRNQQVALAGDVGNYTSATYSQLQSDQAKADTEQAKLNESVRSHQAQEQLRADSNAISRGQLHRQQRKDKADANKPKKPKWTAKDVRAAREKWRKAWTLTTSAGPKRSEGNAFVTFLTSKKGIPEPIARGVVQTHLFGGVRPPQRRKLQRSYGLKPKVIPKAGTRRTPPVLAPFVGPRY